MVIVNCCHKILPNPNLPSEESFREVSRFYVAMTRARKNLIISYHGKPSSFVEKSIEKYFIHEKWSETIDLMDKPRIKVLNESGRLERFQRIDYSENKVYGSLNGKQLLLTRKAIGISKERQDKLLKYITGIRKKAQAARNETWKSLNELFNDEQVKINIALADGLKKKDITKEVGYFEKLFEIKTDSKKKITPEKTVEVLKAESHHKESTSFKETKNNWNVILDNTGKCMHCGDPAIPGDYVCYQCNPG
jgi:hypothetical protein